jgi:hypothetical protein
MTATFIIRVESFHGILCGRRGDCTLVPDPRLSRPGLSRDRLPYVPRQAGNRSEQRRLAARGVAEVYRLVVAQFKSLGGGTGTSLAPSVTSAVPGIEWVKALLEVRTPAARDIVSYWVALALMVGTLIFVYLMLRSRRGLALGAIRDHETAAAGLGVDIYRTKLAVYVATAGVVP